MELKKPLLAVLLVVGMIATGTAQSTTYEKTILDMSNQPDELSTLLNKSGLQLVDDSATAGGKAIEVTSNGQYTQALPVDKKFDSFTVTLRDGAVFILKDSNDNSLIDTVITSQNGLRVGGVKTGTTADSTVYHTVKLEGIDYSSQTVSTVYLDGSQVATNHDYSGDDQMNSGTPSQLTVFGQEGSRISEVPYWVQSTDSTDNTTDENTTDNTTEDGSTDLGTVLDLNTSSSLETFATETTDIETISEGLQASSDNASVTFNAFKISDHGNLTVKGNFSPDSTGTVEILENGTVTQSKQFNLSSETVDLSGLPNGTTEISFDLLENDTVTAVTYTGALQDSDSNPVGGGGITGGFFEEPLNFLSNLLNQLISFITGLIP